MEVETTYVKCRRCGWLHFAVSAEYAHAHVESMNHYLCRLPAAERASFGKPSLSAYLRCFKCGADSVGFLAAKESDAPSGATLQPVVVER